MPFTSYEAEDAITDGSLIGPDRDFGTLPSEASGRRAVRLDKAGNSITFTLASVLLALAMMVPKV